MRGKKTRNKKQRTNKNKARTNNNTKKKKTQISDNIRKRTKRIRLKRGRFSGGEVDEPVLRGEF